MLFPPLREADFKNIATAQYPIPLSLVTVVISKEVKSVIRWPKSDKAPGINKIPSRFLRQVLKVFLPHFTHLFQTCVDFGYHPKEFQIANMIVLKKLWRENYSLAESYQLIALLNTLGKALETIFAHCLSDLAKIYNLLPSQQMGACRNRSTETALELLVESVHTVWDCNRKNVASLLSLDVARAFDHVSHPQLLHNLKSKGIPDYMIRWIKSFLKAQSTSITIRRKTSDILFIDAEIPQRSSILLVLFFFFNAPFIEECANSGLQVQVGEFVDDIHLIEYSTSIEANCKILERAHRICLKWAQRHGVSFAPRKYELIHLTRNPKKFNMVAQVDLSVYQILLKT